ncbi:hypothetical protein ACWT_3885 [Actinoplanes sp. SE50]|uniref:HdeD family acid-resistance protein n=1 Tax=unclassified Actinoplanes TaxID=2626549 RepID=UPI00023ED08B|nr:MULTISPECIES: DUF308 domain-containing protein [unclassified Actinoplanes]AEV84909.1 hypothetical protein ACPL_4014 [Actinoplanes sp. SE50/110]ATO83300.1 hypothetical protein ACWT_3885 [Actinoplanes sp. SE50]SLM00707.1 uncharacterized protein ACSP50_3940 [Actinoplanes sp. SE50/110]
MFRRSGWLSLLAGVFALVLGIVAFAWPSATLHVVGFLFGLNLLILGVVRVVQFVLIPDAPVAGRVLGVIFGVLVGLLGILCLRDLAGSLKLLLVIVALGWMLDGLAEIFTSVGSGGGGARIAVGLCVVLAAVALLVWPGLGLATFVFFGATTLCFVGIAGILIGIAGLRSRSA